MSNIVGGNMASVASSQSFGRCARKTTYSCTRIVYGEPDRAAHLGDYYSSSCYNARAVGRLEILGAAHILKMGMRTQLIGGDWVLSIHLI